MSKASFYNALFDAIGDTVFPTNKDERDLNNILFPLINKHPKMAVYRSLDPGGMQNSLGCDGIVDYSNNHVVVECKRILTKTCPGINDQEKLYKLLTPSQKISYEKCRKTKSLFLYGLYFQNRIYFIEAKF
jgi:hypothetical protein